MKNLTIAILALASSMVFASDYNVDVDYEGKGYFKASSSNGFEKNYDVLGRVITDYQNTCDRGCRYYMPDLTEVRVFGDVRSGKYYTWRAIDSTKDSQFFEEVEVTEYIDEKVIIKAKLVSRELGKELSERYGLPHTPMFEQMSSTWTFTQLAEGYSRAEFSYSSYTTSRLLRSMSRIVKSQLKKSIEATAFNLSY